MNAQRAVLALAAAAALAGCYREKREFFPASDRCRVGGRRDADDAPSPGPRRAGAVGVDGRSGRPNAVYWYFVVLSWLPIYAVIYLAPRG